MYNKPEEQVIGFFMWPVIIFAGVTYVIEKISFFVQTYRIELSFGFMFIFAIFLFCRKCNKIESYKNMQLKRKSKDFWLSISDLEFKNKLKTLYEDIDYKVYGVKKQDDLFILEKDEEIESLVACYTYSIELTDDFIKNIKSIAYEKEINNIYIYLNNEDVSDSIKNKLVKSKINIIDLEYLIKLANKIKT